jgi:hypothetical protein
VFDRVVCYLWNREVIKKSCEVSALDVGNFSLVRKMESRLVWWSNKSASSNTVNPITIFTTFYSSTSFIEHHPKPLVSQARSKFLTCKNFSCVSQRLLCSSL